MVRKTLSMLLASAVLIGAGSLRAGAAPAADGSKPVALVSLASYDELVKDVGALGKLVDRPELGTALDGLVAAVTQGKGLAGLDKSRPVGIILTWDGSKPAGYAFAPVKDLKQLLGVLELYAKVEDGGSGLYTVAAKGKNKKFYVKGAGPWAFVAEKPEALAGVVTDPSSLLAGMDGQYLLAARLFAANLPDAVREKFIADVTRGVQKSLSLKSGESDAVSDARKKLGKEVVDSLTGAMNDLDQVTLGWALDRQTERTFLDLSVTARSGSPLASQMVIEKIASSFRGFRLPGAALTGNWAGMLPAAKIEMLSTLIDAGRAQALQDIEKKHGDGGAVLKPIVNDLADFARKTVKSGRCDGAVAVLLDSQSATALAGGYVADGPLLEKALRALADLVGQQQPVVQEWVKFDAARMKDVRFHTLSVPLPPDTKEREKVVQLIGETVEVVVGIGPTSAYLAVGRDALGTLKRAIEASAAVSSATALPVDISVAIEPIARFVAVVGKAHERPAADMIDKELKKTPGQDHVRLVGRPIPQGFQYRLEVEPGIVRLISSIAVFRQQRHR